MSKFRSLYLSVAAFCLMPIPNVFGDLMVHIGDLSLSPNASGFVDITIVSNANDPLSFYSMDLQILRSGTSTLEFTIQPEPHIPDSDYLFFGDTFGGGLSLPDTTVDSNDTLLGAGDFTDSGFDVDVPGLPALLYRLQVQHFEDPLAPGASGDTFTMTPIDFAFEDSLGNPYTPVFTSGTVTISAAAIPEPHSFWLILLVGVAAWAGRGEFICRLLQSLKA